MEVKKDILCKENAQENLNDGLTTHQDVLGHNSDDFTAVPAKKESNASALSEHVVNDPFDLKSKSISRVTAKICENEAASSCKSYGSDEEVSISDVESEESLKSQDVIGKGQDVVVNEDFNLKEVFLDEISSTN